MRSGAEIIAEESRLLKEATRLNASILQLTTLAEIDAAGMQVKLLVAKLEALSWVMAEPLTKSKSH